LPVSGPDKKRQAAEEFIAPPGMCHKALEKFPWRMMEQHSARCLTYLGTGEVSIKGIILLAIQLASQIGNCVANCLKELANLPGGSSWLAGLRANRKI
jgi:hypothetical protein